VSRRGEAALLLGPLVLFLVALLGFPFLANLAYGLTRLTFATLRDPAWAGLANYATALSDPAFGHALLFSLRFALLATAAEVLLGLALALALEPLIARHRWLMAFLLLPMMVSPALLGVMWRLLLNEFVGIVPNQLAEFGLFPSMLGPDLVVLTLVLIEVLQWTPFAFLVIFTGLQAIPAELLEAARIDGANAAQRLSRVVLPLLAPAIAIAAGIRFIDGFRVFDHVYVLTGGGPGTLTTSASIHIYKSFFQAEDLGVAVAKAMLLFAASLLLVVLATRLTLRGGRA
jgi:multiple sugar transport system permease protein